MNFFPSLNSRLLTKVNVFALCLACVFMSAFFFSRYREGGIRINYISIETALDARKVVAYCQLDQSNEMDFAAPYFGMANGKQLIFDLKGRKTRLFRIYPGQITDS